MTCKIKDLALLLPRNKQPSRRGTQDLWNAIDSG